MPAALGGLQQHRDGEGRVVEVPAKFLAFRCEVNIDRRQGVVVGVHLVDAQHSAQKRPERRIVVDRPEGRVGGDLVVGDEALAAHDLSVVCVIVAELGLWWRDVHVVGRVGVEGITLTMLGLSNNRSDRLWGEEGGQHKGSMSIELLGALCDVARIIDPVS